MIITEFHAPDWLVFALYVLVGIFFTFIGGIMKGATFYMCGLVATAVAIDFVIVMTETEFGYDMNPNWKWAVVSGGGILGAWILGANEKLSMFLSCCIPISFLMAVGWQAVNVDGWGMPRDPFLKGIVCMTIATIFSTVLVVHFSFIYDNFFCFTTAVLGSYFLACAGTTLYKMVTGDFFVYILPTHLINFRAELWKRDPMEVGLALLVWMGVCLIGVLFQYFLRAKINKKRELAIARERAQRKARKRKAREARKKMRWKAAASRSEWSLPMSQTAYFECPDSSFSRDF